MTDPEDAESLPNFKHPSKIRDPLTFVFGREFLPRIAGCLGLYILFRGLPRNRPARRIFASTRRFAVQFNGAALGFKVFDKIQTVPPGAIADNKRLPAVLEQVKAQQAAYPPRQQRGHVARQRPPNNLEAPGLPSKGRAPRRGAAAAPA